MRTSPSLARSPSVGDRQRICWPGRQERPVLGAGASPRRDARAVAAVAVAAVAVALLAGCTHVPEGRQGVTALRVEGVSQIDRDDLLERLATAPSPKFLGLFQEIVYEPSLFSSLVLARDLERIQRFYRARGFLDAAVRAARIEERDEKHVVVTIEIREGASTSIATSVVEEAGVVLATADRDAAPTDDPLRRRLARTLRKSAGIGARFDEDDVAATEAALRRNLEDAGFPYATVARRSVLRAGEGGIVADVRFEVSRGPKANFGEILIELGDTDGEHLRVARAALGLVSGAPYTRSALEEARRALLDLGPFATVDVEPVLATEVPKTTATRVDIRATARPSKLRTLRFGGGLELDVIRSDFHGLIRWENKDFLGAYRTFSIDARPGAVLYPTRLPDFQKPERLLLEAKVRASLANPAFFEGRTVGTARVEYNVFPVLLSSNASASTVLGYQELRANLGLERPFGRFFLATGYGVQANFPFAYVGAKDPDLAPVFLIYPTVVAQYDLRDNKVTPHRGAFFSVDVQAAGLPGGSALDFRVAPEARGYVPLGRRTTLAVRGAFGFLAPANYGDTLRENASGSGPPDGVSRARWVRDVQLTYLRAFFGGGPNSNRGYPLRGIGPHGLIPFYSPEQSTTALEASCSSAATYDAAKCAQPLGGLSLWEASAEVRFVVAGPLGGATFCDVGDVGPRAFSPRFDRLHLSCGLGVRYGTPVGPIRLDVGARIPGAQLLGGTTAGDDGVPGTLFTLPIAVALGIGEAF